MATLNGNRRLIYEALRSCGNGARVSYGTLAYQVGCSRETVRRAMLFLLAQGLIYSYHEEGRAKKYRFP